MEDPEAPLPDHVTSDREPPPALNTINIDDYESEEEVGSSGPSVSSLPHPGHATEPTEWEARRREEALKAEYPQFAKVRGDSHQQSERAAVRASGEGHRQDSGHQVGGEG